MIAASATIESPRPGSDYIRADEIAVGDEAATPIGTAPVAAVESGRGRTLIVTATNGYAVQVTPDQQVPTHRNGQVVAVTAEDLKPGDALIVDTYHEVIVDPTTKEGLPFYFSRVASIAEAAPTYVRGLTITAHDQPPWFFADGIAVAGATPAHVAPVRKADAPLAA